MINPRTAKLAKDIPTIWPVFRLPCACGVGEATFEGEPEVMAGPNSPDFVIVENVGVEDVPDGGCPEKEDEGDKVVEGVDEAGAEVEGEGIEGAPVSVVMPVELALVTAGMLILGARAEENASEPGAS